MSTDEAVFTLMLIDHAAIVGDADGAHMAIVREWVDLPDLGTTWMERYSLVRASLGELRAIIVGAQQTSPTRIPGVVTAQAYVPFDAIDKDEATLEPLATLRKELYKAAGRCTLEVLDHVSCSDGVAALAGERWGPEFDLRLVVLDHERFQMLASGTLVLHELSSDESKTSEEPDFHCQFQRNTAMESLRAHPTWLLAERVAKSDAEADLLTRALAAQRADSDTPTRKRI